MNTSDQPEMDRGPAGASVSWCTTDDEAYRKIYWVWLQLQTK